jgi:hypothetical protein
MVLLAGECPGLLWHLTASNNGSLVSNITLGSTETKWGCNFKMAPCIPDYMQVSSFRGYSYTIWRQHIMKDLAGSNFQELSSEELDSTEGGFILSAALRGTSTVFNAVTSAITDIRPESGETAERVNRTAHTIMGTISDISNILGGGLFSSRRNRNW